MSSPADLPVHAIHSLIVLLSKHRLSLAGIRKPAYIRIYVIAPNRILYDETNIDCFHSIEPLVGELDKDYSPLIQKARELALVYNKTIVRLFTFERALQRPVAELRKELRLRGLLPDMIEQLARVGEQYSRRLGLPTPRVVPLNGQVKPEGLIQHIKASLPGYPMMARPARQSELTSITDMRRLECDDDIRQWLKTVYSNSHASAEWLIEECMNYGQEFIVMIASCRRVIYCLCSNDISRTFYESLIDHRPYIVELLTVGQMRDIMPGLESFCHQAVKGINTLMEKPLEETVFIRGFYRDHNNIWLQGVSTQPTCESFATLLKLPVGSPGWEAFILESDYNDNEEISTPGEPFFHAMVNFPCYEGTLIHQAMIPRRLPGMRVSYRIAEGQELRACDNMDMNIMQVFAWHMDRQQLMDVLDEVSSTMVTVDRSALADRAASLQRSLKFVRSVTTAD